MTSGIFSSLTYLTGPSRLMSFSTPVLPIYGYPVKIVLLALVDPPFSTPQNHRRSKEHQRQVHQTQKYLLAMDPAQCKVF
jgi:hypothetical protein